MFILISGNSISKDKAVDATNGSKDEGKSSSEQSDADVEDNLEEPPRRADTHTASIGSQAVAHTAANFAAYHMESGYNSDKLVSSDSIRTSPVDLDKEKTDDTPETTDKDKEFADVSTSTTDVPLEYKSPAPLETFSNPDSGVASPEATKHNSTETVDNVDSPSNGKDLGSHSSLSSEINLDLSSPQRAKLSPVRSDFERPVSRISFAPEYSNEVVSRGISERAGRDLFESGWEFGGAPPEDNAYDDLNQDVTDKLEKLKLDADEARPKPAPPAPRAREPPPARPSPPSPRYVCDEDECSVQSCLGQFTALELLTGNNKVGCETCTERLNGKNGKTVYTNATKRFLVSSPPPVLILHLKRFQLGPRCMFRKMSKHVDFPTLLDLAPFCAAARGGPLYALYGVVEHSGGMHGGHYVAYVKQRPGARRRFLPTGDSDSELSGYESGDGAARAPRGRWFYVSDSLVSEVTEDKVLRAQAYLLFYERVQ